MEKLENEIARYVARGGGGGGSRSMVDACHVPLTSGTREGKDSMNEMQSVGVSRARHSISILLGDQKPISSIWRGVVSIIGIVYRVF